MAVRKRSCGRGAGGTFSSAVNVFRPSGRLTAPLLSPLLVGLPRIRPGLPNHPIPGLYSVL